MMSEAVHLDGMNVAYSVRWGRGMTKAQPEWNRLKSAIEYFQAYDVEIHIHVPAWARERIQRLCEVQLNDSVNFHYIYIPRFDSERDDKDLLAWSLFTNGYIVSNDTMQNHIESGSIKQEWFSTRRIPYHFTKNGEFRPKLPTEFPFPMEEEE